MKFRKICLNLLVFVLFVSLIISSVPFIALAQNNSSTPDAIHIQNATQLAGIGGAQSAGKYYVLDNDINLVGEWVPVDDFRGTFDGQGYSVNNLYVLASSNRQYAGLFGKISVDGVTIKNVGININSNGLTASFFGSVFAGGLVGRCEYGVTVENSFSTGSIKATTSIVDDGAFAGGLVGYNNYGIISVVNSYTTGSITAITTATAEPPYFDGAFASAGGLIGYSFVNGAISVVNSYTTGSITATSYNYVANAGGLVGYSYGGDVTVENSYTTGKVSAFASRQALVGGLVGGSVGAFGNTTVVNSYVTGVLNAVATPVYSAGYAWAGGLIGYSSGGFRNTTVVNSYVTGVITATASDAIGYGSGFVVAGGLIGTNGGGGAVTVVDSYATGNVTATTSGLGDVYAGGLVGSSNTMSGGIVTVVDSYATGNVTATTSGSAAWVGGLVGYGYNGVVVTSSYRLSTQKIIGVTINEAGTPLTPEEMQNPASFVDWDFETIWTIDSDHKINGGFPYLWLRDFVQPLISIVVQPEDASVVEGSIDGCLVIDAYVNPSGALGYKWYQCLGVNSNPTTDSLVGTEVSFTIPTNLVAGTYYYYCVVNAIGAESVTSNLATVIVNSLGSVVLDRIEITVLPDKMTYFEGEVLNLAGLVVTATYSDGAANSVMGYTTSPLDGSVLSVVGVQTVTVSHVENSITKTATFVVIVVPHEGDVVHIQTAAQLATIGGVQSAGKYYVLDNDVFLVDEWTPIDDFRGIFDGQGHSVNNLYILESSGVSYAGLFGQITTSGVLIKNVGVNISSKGITANFSSDVYVSASAGGLVGYNIGGVIVVNCYVTGDVTAVSSGSSSAWSGGLIGYSYGGDVTVENSYTMGNVTAISDFSAIAGGLVGCLTGVVEKSYATGNITATVSKGFVYAGGLVGYSNGVNVVKCYATGTVTATASSHYAFAGGLVGFGGVVSVEKCYATGTVTAVAVSYTHAYAGGLIGQGNAVSISNSYATGNVNATAPSTAGAGGLVCGNAGEYTITISVKNSYATGNITATTSSGGGRVGGLVGSPGSLGRVTVADSYRLSTQIISGVVSITGSGVVLTPAQMRLQSSFVGWDFDTVWGIDSGMNGGFPYLRGLYSVPLMVSVGGVVKSQGSTVPVTVSLYDSDGNFVTSTETAPDGSYVLSVPEGTGYMLIVTRPGYLSYTIKNLSFVDGQNIDTIDFAVLGGDVNGDGVVDGTDLTLFLSAYNAGVASGLYPFADLNGDGVVDATDLTIFLAGYNKSNIVKDMGN